MTNDVPRWKCISYCLCPSSRNTGHFECADDGAWVRYEDIKHLLHPEPKAECPHCREVYEIWANMEGFVQITAAEHYQRRRIEQMRDAAAKGLALNRRGDAP